MGLALLTLCLLCTPPAHAQGGYPGGGWSVTDHDGNPISPNQDGSGYPLCGVMTGTPPDLTGAYPDVFAAASLPNPPVNYAFTPNLWSNQYWLYTGDPCPTGASVWTTASASNNVSTRSGSVMGYLSGYGNENVVGSLDPSTGGTLWAIFTAPQGQTVPDHINVLLTTTVQASASVNPTPSMYLSATGTATDSLNETAQASADGSGGGVPLVTGRHLLRVPVDARTSEAQVSLGGTTTATATDNVPYGVFSTPPTKGYYSMTNGPTNAVASASISAAAKIDSRDLTLYRDGAERGFIGNDGLQHGDWTDASGTTHGETIYSYLMDQNLTINKQFLHPRFIGSWNPPPASWAWDTYSQVPRQWNSAEYDILLGNVSYVNGEAVGTVDSPYTYNLSYTATDSDGATATANYVLTAHYQWENKRLDPAYPFDVIDHDDLVSVGGQFYPAQENDDYTEDSPVGPLTIGFNLTFALSAQLNGSFKLSDFFTLGGNFQPSISISASASQAIVGPPIPPRCYIQLKWHTHYHKNHWLTDHYTPAGFDASYLQLIDGDVTYNSLHWGHPIQLDGSGLGG